MGRPRRHTHRYLTPMQLRTYVDADQAAVAELWQRAGLMQNPLNDPVRDIAFCVAGGHGEILVLEDAGIIVATVMVLQRWSGMSDREAVAAFEFDARFKYACGGLAFDHPGFAHTVLVDMRARLARSDRPRRIFDVVLGAAREAGVVGTKRALDSTPLYDAVATQDTVTMIRSAIRHTARLISLNAAQRWSV